MKVGLVDLVTPPCGKNLTTVKIDILNISSMQERMISWAHSLMLNATISNKLTCLAKK